MKKRFLTADVIRARKADGFQDLIIEPGDVLTPLARDTARELGIRLHDGGPAAQPPAGQQAQPTAPPAQPPLENDALSVEGIVRQVVAACLARMGNAQTPTAQIPVKVVQSQSVQMQPFPFEIHRPEMDVQLVDVITAQHGSPMGAGFLSFHKGSFPWTLTYDEIEIVLEGEIHIGTAQGTAVGKPGDILYIPKGTEITFGTPGWAKILYVTYPAEWAG